MSFSRLNRRVDQLLSHRGIDEESLQLKKNVWVGNVAVALPTGGMTIMGWLLHLPIIVHYGYAILAITLSSVFVTPFLRKYVDWMNFLLQLACIWVTFYFMLSLGGLLTSAGLIFTGISILSLSIGYQNNRMTLALFFAYLLTLVITALLQPRLQPAPGMTAGKNLLFFTVNFSWQAGMVVMLILNNINQKRKISEAKKAEAERLRELDAMKTRFFTNITHEFRTPLTIILGMSDLMKENPGEWLEKGTDKIRRNGEHLLKLVNQMLDLSRLEAGAMPLRTFQHDIIAQLNYLTESFQSLAQARHVRMRLETDTGRYLMDYDADKMMQVLVNLLSNAVKYTPEGGQVTLSTRLIRTDALYREISVADTGRGIPAEHLEHIFDRFFRVGESVEESGTGTGLGLAVSQELVRLMKGKILVNSIPGEVTTFTVIMPVTNEAMISEGPEFGGPGEISPLVPDGRTDINTDRSTEESDEPLLLIVEDNTDLVQYLTAILQKEYRVESASNGREGLEKVLDRMPDIVLSDVMMPEMDGITMLQKIKEDQRSSHIPVVMLTAKADIASRLEGLERGADAYLAKPFNAEELLVQLRNLIRTRRLLFERYSAMDSLPQTDDRALQMEDDFILRVREIMELHLDDENFGIIRLCEEIGMSRAQLYRKFKVLTDKTVNDYLRDYRLHRAKCLLESTRINVSEAAYRVGFKNLSHFSRVFTETYGINPSGVGKEDRH